MNAFLLCLTAAFFVVLEGFKEKEKPWVAVIHKALSSEYEPLTKNNQIPSKLYNVGECHL